LRGVIYVVAAGLLSSITELPNRAVQKVLQSQLDSLLEGGVEIGKIEHLSPSLIELRDVRIKDSQGVLLDVSLLRLDISPMALIRKTVRSTKLTLHADVLDLTTNADGLRLLQAFPSGDPNAPSSPWTGLPINLEIDAVDLQIGELKSDAESLKAIELSGAATLIGPELNVDGLQLNANSGYGPLALGGRVMWDGDRVDAGVDLRALKSHLSVQGGVTGLTGTMNIGASATIHQLDMDAIDPLLGAGLAGTWTGSLGARGPLNNLGVDVALNGGGGSATLKGTLDLDTPAYSAVLDTNNFALERLLPVVGGPLVLSAKLDAKGEGFNWPGLAVRGKLTGGSPDLYGIRIRNIDTPVSLIDGVVRVDNGEVSAVAGTVNVTGGFNILDGSLGLDAAGKLDLSMLKDLGLEDFEGTGTVQARVDGETYRDGVPIDVKGTATLDEAVLYGVEVKDLSTPLRVHIEDGNTRVEVSPTVGEVDAYGFRLGGVEGQDMVVRLEDDVIVNGRVQALFAGQADVSMERLDVALDLTLPADGEMDLRTQLQWSDLVVFQHPIGAGAGSFGMLGEQIRWRLATSSDSLFTAGIGHLDTGRFDGVQLRMATEPLRVETVRPASFRLVEGGADYVNVQITANEATVAARGAIRTVGELNGDVVVDRLDLTALMDFLHSDLALGGVVSLNTHLEGTAEDPTIDLSLEGVDLEYAGFGPIAARATLNVADGVADVDFQARDELKLIATLPFSGGIMAPQLDPERPIVVDLMLDSLDTQEVANFISLPPGKVSGRMLLDGTLKEPEFELGSVASMVFGSNKPLRLELTGGHREKHSWIALAMLDGFSPLATLGAELEAEMGEIFTRAAAGEDVDLAAHIGEIHADIAAHDADLGAIAEQLDVPVEMRGVVDAELTVDGRLESPQIAGNGDIKLVSEGRAAELQFDLAHVEQDYSIMGLLSSGAGLFEVQAQVPLEIRPLDGVIKRLGPMTVDVDGDDLELAIFSEFVPGVSDLSGKLSGHGHAEIDTNIVAEGQLDLDQAALVLPELGVRYEQVDGHIEFTPDGSVPSVTLDARTYPAFRSSRKSGPESRIQLEGSGSVTDVLTLDAKAHLEKALLIGRSSSQLRASGDLAVSGDWPALEAAGDLRVDGARFSLGLGSWSGAAGLQPHESMRIHRDGSVAVAEVKDEESFLDYLKADVSLDLGRAVTFDASVPIFEDLGQAGAVLMRADIKVRLGGKLAATLRDGTPELVGEIEVPEGTIKVLSSQFELTDGLVTFVGGDISRPILDLSAEMYVSDGSVKMTFTGPPDDPEVTFSSDEYPDESQIFTILLTGQAPDDLTAEGGAATLSSLTGLLLNSVFGGMQIGSVGIDADGSIRVGVPVYRTLYLESILNPTPEWNENQFTFGAEWTIIPRLVLDGSFGNRISELYLNWEYRF